MSKYEIFNVKKELEKIGFKDMTKEFEGLEDSDILELELPNGGCISVASQAGWELDEYDLDGGQLIEIVIKTNSGFELSVN